MAVDWEIGNDGDLTLASGDFVFVDESYRVAQAIETTLRTLQGEWFLNTAFGVPYFQSILGQKMISIDIYDALIRAAVVGVDDVNRILEFSSSFDHAQRVYSVTFKADTIFGPVDFEGSLT